MTTGRINQVTILSRHAPEGTGQPPAGAGGRAVYCGEVARERCLDARGPQSQGYDGFPGRDPIAPTVFPKGRSAVRPVGRQAPSRGITYDPQEEVAVS
jgi:hypothetical protein